jgi:hypothetical protein
MSDTPNFRFNRKPRFSVNHLTSYLSTTNAGQRDRVIQQAKFPKKVPVAMYGQARRAIQTFWGTGTSATGHFDVTLAKLQAQARNEADRRDDALRCIAAIERFQAIYDTKRWNGLTLASGPVDLAFRRSEVLINVRLDCQIFKTVGDEMVTGGVVLFYANTPDSRKSIDERRRQVASLVRWALEEAGQMEPLPSLCLSFDIFGDAVVKSPDAKDRFRDAVDQSCKEVALKWDSIEPPSGYDGPNWR